jgi:hypothetical protein
MFFRLSLLATFCSVGLFATPTSIFWTNCTTDVVAANKWHSDLDNYFSVGNRAKNGSSFPPDIGVTYGLPSSHGFGGEIGIDYLGGVSHPWFFNGKVALEEGKLFEKAPSFSVGVFGIGTTHATNQEVFDAVVGYTLPQHFGRIFAGLFHGKRALGKHRSGWMAAYELDFYPAKDDTGKEYNKWEFLADYASGKNAIGGGGFALLYSFTPTVSLLTGPVWFNDTALNGRWKWSVQLNIDI